MAIPILAALAQPAMEIIGELIDRAFPDSQAREAKRLEYQLKLQEELNKIDLAQLNVNAAEAANPNIFVAGWRPFIGWVCGVAFAYHFIGQPFMAFVLSNMGYLVTLPSFNMDVLNTVLMGMLGLGGLRTMEKIKGV